MTDLSEKLSAYLDGELDVTAAKAVEARLATDPLAQAELDSLLQADALALEGFEEQLNDPLPFTLAQQIKSTKLPEIPTTAARPVWGRLVASLAIFAIGCAGGYIIKGQTAPVQTASVQPPPVQMTGWLNSIADYHGIYANQGRHLVEVGADESDHLKAWLAKTVGVRFSIPDLSKSGLTFKGGRLVVANGKPVAQLMYQQADGTVIALCLQNRSKPSDDAPVFKDQTIKGFDFVSWNADGADYVVIGPAGQPNLTAIAKSASLEI